MNDHIPSQAASDIDSKPWSRRVLRLPLLHKKLFRAEPGAKNRFQLLKRFSLVSLSSFAIATGVLAGFYRHRAVQSLVIAAEENNVVLTQVFANTVWPEYGTFLSSTQNLSDEELAAHPTTERLYQDILAKFEGVHVAKVKVFDLQGRTVFSSDLSQIGADKSQSQGFLAAISGSVVSQLGHRDTFQALQTTLTDRHLLSSYVPIYAEGSEQEILGVFELYTDVTPLVTHISQTQRSIILGSVLILAVLFILLLVFVQRADRLLKQQYHLLQKSEGRYRRQADELEQALSELRQTQAQMLQSEKMSSLGQLVAGVAHEINNPVSFIHGNIGHTRNYIEDLLGLVVMYERHYPQPETAIQAEAKAIDLEFIRDDLPKTLNSMQVGSDRIREIVVSLRNFSRLDEAEIKAVDIHNGIDSTLIILNHRLAADAERPKIQVVKHYASLPKIQCFAGLLNQVFMNILSNAIDALDEKSHQQTPKERQDQPGQITIRTALVRDGWVGIEIADNGLGISPEIEAKILNPFFTTKPIGKGTGMGMSISYKIITERHGGSLTYASTPGQGTQFRIQIPIAQVPTH
ncbi:MAG: HAMP domain-containing histidine kinase [Leptolyngbya sp. SIOISBB]|nr:HAMP domain-containing histidine kinase [Leptolyngbya sp. SIOISBB]